MLTAACLSVIALLSVACAAPAPAATLAGSPATGPAPDPTDGTFFPWDLVDRAVAKGAIGHLVVATPTEEVGAQFRTYRLLGPRDEPGVLRAERTDQGLALTVRIGRFGRPDLEARVLDSVRQALAEADAE